MDYRGEVRDFLRTRRARVTPDQVNLITGGNRRVPGLRREEVALLAGVSVDYYAQLERGNLAGVSDEVLEAIARALRLDEAETAHLFDLARAVQPKPVRRARKASTGQVRPSLQRLLDAITDAPAWVRDERMDIVATNSLGRALNAPLFDDPRRPVNNARFVFLNEDASRRYYTDWEKGADDIVAAMRGYAAQRPHDKQLTDLIGELVTRSDAFRTRWAAHNVRYHRTGIKRLHHPVVGDLELTYEALDLPADPGWHLFAFTAEPGSPSDERLRVLASWAATGEGGAGADAADDVEPSPMRDLDRG
ncbi:helix-turn-helix transcriptional regulator [Microbacterium sp.]|uniref:helix-turn-helix domain-containing protein n=1 Tax=Microbacterium sp. TaxID=51671 RepID=UPI002C371F8D|nr:helix-turn-helix transcriptional regulator [Microbacterium sp.]HWL76503.1 helix-turn-helix transcriptional regulator [Microbacterium sp.]